MAPVTASAIPTRRTVAVRSRAMEAHGGMCFPASDTTAVAHGQSTAARDKLET